MKDILLLIAGLLFGYFIGYSNRNLFLPNKLDKIAVILMPFIGLIILLIWGRLK